MRATAADPAGYAVAYLDIDRFKQLNDTHGHAAGDRALRAFATTLRRRLRPRDLIGRWGGEEFLAVLPDCDRDQARTVMERLRADLLDTLAAGDTPGFTISCGIATSADAPTFADVVHRADQALARRQSRRPRPRHRLHHPLLTPPPPRALAVEVDEFEARARQTRKDWAVRDGARHDQLIDRYRLGDRPGRRRMIGGLPAFTLSTIGTVSVRFGWET